MTSVAITFQVEQAIRGTRVGQQLTIHEWAGPWTAGERYRVGRTADAVSARPQQAGTHQPVGGAAGRFAVDQAGRILLDPVQAQNLKGAPVPIRIDRNRSMLQPDFKRAIQRMPEE